VFAVGEGDLCLKWGAVFGWSAVEEGPLVKFFTKFLAIGEKRRQVSEP